MMTNLETRATTPITAVPDPTSSVSVLLVGSNDRDWARLAEIFRHTHWKLFRARDFSEAADYLRLTRIPVMVTETNLTQGRTWRDVLDLAFENGRSRVIVASPSQDDPLWAQVINLGAYDVLMKPFDRAEVVRVVSLAWLNWRDEMTSGKETQQQVSH